ncbi:fungal-specific transcription factor domain-containing protein [Xylaria bambusicola]|uniref:fungal-specific transcription factor domain-containing protein n=1 Tax=Xylaria bambusicola TaxID=326684 RepID=UPI0020073A0A|nr:fungal-specific transcription factor domain-containing protein [Xylaria bambusicola]KAI0505579.1 fungal-specific transcription factor domain-containing protein [Xylaria bambusicola]
MDRRVGVRKNRLSGTRLRAPGSRSIRCLQTPDLEEVSPSVATTHLETTPPGDTNTPSSEPRSFINRCSDSYYGETGDINGVEETPFTSPPNLQALRKSVQLDPTPRPVLIRAWADAYWQSVFHYCPVLEAKDLDGSNASTALGKAICLVGNLVRPNPRGFKLANELYEEVKLLICLDLDRDTARTLKAICLLSLWSAKPSNPITLDGPWHWIAVAVRLALQMGLYRECTYVNRSDAKSLRRIFWTLHNNDTLEAACWNRPPLLRRNDFNVELPTRDDFDMPCLHSVVFIESSKLCTIISRTSELHRDRRPIELEEFSRVETSLCDWVNSLPGELRLFDEGGTRKSYCRPVSELLIQYFVAIILSEFLRCRDRGGPRRVSVASLLSASCAVTLYEEIDCRDEARLPHHNGFYCLVLALPIIHRTPQNSEQKSERERNLAVLRSILKGLDGKYGDAKWGVAMMDKLKTRIDRTLDSRCSGNSEHLESSPVSNRMFPFPPDFCDNMALLEQTTGPNAEFSVANLNALQDWSVDNSTLDCTWLDLFRFDVADMNGEFQNSVQ